MMCLCVCTDVCCGTQLACTHMPLPTSPFSLKEACLDYVQVRVAVGGQSKRTEEAEGRENLDWEETLV